MNLCLPEFTRLLLALDIMLPTPLLRNITVTKHIDRYTQIRYQVTNPITS